MTDAIICPAPYSLSVWLQATCFMNFYKWHIPLISDGNTPPSSVNIEGAPKNFTSLRFSDNFSKTAESF